MWKCKSCKVDMEDSYLTVLIFFLDHFSNSPSKHTPDLLSKNLLSISMFIVFSLLHLPTLLFPLLKHKVDRKSPQAGQESL